MKHRVLLILSLFLILSPKQTNATEELQIQLQKNEAAPYSGVLVPELHYRKFHVDIFERDLYAEQWKDCMEERFELEQAQSTWTRDTGFLAGGLALGLLTALLVRR